MSPHRPHRACGVPPAPPWTLLRPRDERSLLRDIEKMLKVEIQVEKAPEGTYVDALADPDGDFAPPTRPAPQAGRPSAGRKAAGPGPQACPGPGRGGKPGQGRAAEGQHAGKPGGNRHHPAAAGANQNGDQPAKPRRSRRGGDAVRGPSRAATRAVA